MGTVRINRFLSQAGLGSRRKVEAYVRAGRIRINGKISTDLAVVVDPDRDRVELDGRSVATATAGRILLFHKPVGVVSSFRRQGQARCLLDYVPASWEGRLFHVGRLDRETSGLLLLSDDGDLAHRLLHPSRPVWKTYRVRVDRALDRTGLADFRNGSILLDGRPCALAAIRTRGRPKDGTAVYEVRLREGRTRQIRRMFEALERRVIALHRQAFGPLKLGALAPGEMRRATDAEITALRRAATGDGPGAGPPPGSRR